MDVEEHAKALVTGFIERRKRDRALSLLGKFGVSGLLLERPGTLELDQRWVRRVDPGGKQDAFVDRLHSTLRSYGAPVNCVAFCSDFADLDEQVVPLRETLERIVGSTEDSFLSCLSGKLVYYETDGLNERYILRRPPN